MKSNRIAVLATLFAVFFLMGANKLPADKGFPLEGDWQGTLVTPQAELPIVFHIKRAEDETFSATLDSPAQEAFGIPMDTVELKDHTVRIWSAALQGGFTAELSDEQLDEMPGTWEQMGNSLPLTMRRSKEESS